MKLSFDWLSDYVDLSGLSPEEVAEKITMGAFEVEEVRKIGPSIEGDVVVGEIVEIHPHPNADKIRLTRVKLDASSEPREIVCGAWNIEVGQKVPVALPGAKVVNRHDGSSLYIKESKIRGVTSNGMLCSPPELGLTGGDEGILILESATALGVDVKELLYLKGDWVLYVEPRSNRGDALSVIGLAREVAALFGRQLKEPEWCPPPQQGERSVAVHIENPEDCPFFSARVLSGLKVGPSPDRIVRRLEATGMRPVNNIVDITNYVMHELGQPLHAYDLEHLSGHYLEARRARSGEKLVTIDERERTLSEDVLVIADRQNIVGIAGVMGGKGSEIACNTTAIALEAASFESARVRRSSRCLGLSSDSSLRFERGVDVASVRRASDRAAFLMTKHCGAQVQTLSTAGQDRVQPLTVMLRMSEIARLTELDMMPDTVADLLTPLGFKVHSDTPWDPRNPKVYVDVPSFRRKDVSREVDLVEEVCRLWGYDQVPQSMPRNTIAPSCPDNTLKLVGQALTAAGLSEAWISSLTALEDLNSKGAFGADTAGAVRVLNPLSEEHQVLRQSLIPGLLKAVAYNLDRGRPDVWLFETGRVYIKEFTPASSSKETGTKESLHVSAIVCGQSALSSWNKQTGEVGSEGDFYTAKGIVENLLGHLGVPATRLTFSKDPSVPGWFHPARSCCITWGMSSNGKSEMQSLGFLGQVHPAVADAYGLKKQASIFELNIGSIIAALAARRFEEIHTTPFVIRDLSADVDNNQAYDPVLKCITRCAGDLLKHAELVSIFQLPDNKKSLSFRLSFQHRQDTLTAEVVENILDKVRRRLTEELSATFRA